MLLSMASGQSIRGVVPDVDPNSLRALKVPENVIRFREMDLVILPFRRKATAIRRHPFSVLATSGNVTA
jgi:hypothetical protein